MRLTILDEILMESGYNKIASAEASGRKHQAGCNCIQCRNSYMQAGTGNTHWRKRRDVRQEFIANKTAKNYENNETLSNEEYDLAPVEDGIRKHVILVAGHNWESPGHKFITYCFNRSKRLIKKDKTLEFTIFDFTSGKVIFGKWVR